MQECPDDARVPGRAVALVAGQALLCDYGIEIGSSFGPLHGKIRRIGAMGYYAREDTVLTTLAALDSMLTTQDHRFSRNAGDLCLSLDAAPCRTRFCLSELMPPRLT